MTELQNQLKDFDNLSELLCKKIRPYAEAALNINWSERYIQYIVKISSVYSDGNVLVEAMVFDPDFSCAFDMKITIKKEILDLEKDELDSWVEKNHKAERLKNIRTEISKLKKAILSLEKEEKGLL
jgi:uncharacterized membrane-anchored protein YjiN (DUF445 family)